MALLVLKDSALAKSILDIGSTQPHCAKIVQKANLPNNADCLATNLSTSFSFFGSTDDLERATSLTSPLRFFVGFLCTPRLDETAQQLSDLQQRATGPNTQSLFLAVHNEDEAAEFVLSLVAKLGDPSVKETSQRWIRHAAELPMANPKESVLQVARKGLCIEPRESQAMLEALGSFQRLASMSSADSLVQHTPLTDRDAMIVAQTLGLEQSRQAPSPDRNKVGRFL